MFLRPQLLEKNHEDLLNVHQSYVELLMNIWGIMLTPYVSVEIVFIYFLRQWHF